MEAIVRFLGNEVETVEILQEMKVGDVYLLVGDNGMSIVIFDENGWSVDLIDANIFNLDGVEIPAAELVDGMTIQLQEEE